MPDDENQVSSVENIREGDESGNKVLIFIIAASCTKHMGFTREAEKGEFAFPLFRAKMFAVSRAV